MDRVEPEARPRERVARLARARATGPSAATWSRQARSIIARRRGPPGSGMTMQPVSSTTPGTASWVMRRAMTSRSSGAQARTATACGRSHEASSAARFDRFRVELLREESSEQRPPAPLALAGRRLLRLRVALDRARGQLVDVGEDRVGQVAQDIRRRGPRAGPRPRCAARRRARRPGTPPAARRGCGPGASRPRRAGRRPRGSWRAGCPGPRSGPRSSAAPPRRRA